MVGHVRAKRSSASFTRGPSSIVLEAVGLGNLIVAQRVPIFPLGGLGSRRPKDGHNIVDGNDKEQIIRLEIDRNRVLRVEEDFVVFPNGKILVAPTCTLTSTTRPVMVGISAASGSTIPPRVFCRASSLRTRTRLPTGSTNSLTTCSAEDTL